MIIEIVSNIDFFKQYVIIILGWSKDLGPSADGEVPRHFFLRGLYVRT